MLQQKYSLKKQEEIFFNFVLKNKNVAEILNRGFIDEIKDWYLVAGCLNQTIWNQLTNKAVENEIKDYDIVYYDSDLSEEKEQLIQNEINQKYKDLNINLDVVNQARVHIWIEKDWNLKMRPLVSCEDAVGSWPITVSCVGIRKEGDSYLLIAPYGLTDNLEMVIRPNKTTVMRESDYNYKVNKWIKKWPELTLLPW